MVARRPQLPVGRLPLGRTVGENAPPTESLLRRDDVEWEHYDPRQFDPPPPPAVAAAAVVAPVEMPPPPPPPPPPSSVADFPKLGVGAACSARASAVAGTSSRPLLLAPICGLRAVVCGLWAVGCGALERILTSSLAFGAGAGRGSHGRPAQPSRRIRSRGRCTLCDAWPSYVV